MKTFLLYRDRVLDPQPTMPVNREILEQDLELGTLLGTMAAGDRFLFEISERILLSGLREIDAIRYRQAVLADCLAQPEVARSLYGIAVAAIESEKSVWPLFNPSPEQMLSRSVNVLGHFVICLRQLRRIAEDHGGAFSSEGFGRFFSMVTEELDDEYFATVQDHLQVLKFRRGMLLSARLGQGNASAHHVLRRSRDRGWLERAGENRARFSFTIAARDDGGLQALENLRSRGLNLVANALRRSTDHILAFFLALRQELGFYIGCLNLHLALQQRHVRTSLPDPVIGPPVLRARGICDPCLALHLNGPVVGNDIEASGSSLIMITGANQGGKSTFLRSVGLAQLMMQAGMFVAAEVFSADMRDGIFTHYKREEDAAMRSGKLDEELRRMSTIVDEISPGYLLLCNESFASTNEREGSEIARQVVDAFRDLGVKVLFVTHMFELAEALYRDSTSTSTSTFLRAQRLHDGARSYRLIEGTPLATSFGEDTYHKIFAEPHSP